MITPPKNADEYEKFFVKLCKLVNTFSTQLGGTAALAANLDGPKYRLTTEGGVAIKLTNKTGGASVKGRVITTGATVDNSYIIQTAEYEAVGIEYESGIADGSETWVVVAGIAEVLLKNATAATRGYWVKCADTDGRAEVTTAPAGIGALTTAEHFKEIGHCLESKTAGTDVLAKVVLHFN